MDSINSKSTFRQLWVAGVVAACIFAGFEIRNFILAEQDWASLLTLSGKITVAAGSAATTQTAYLSITGAV